MLSISNQVFHQRNRAWGSTESDNFTWGIQTGQSKKGLLSQLLNTALLKIPLQSLDREK